MADIYLQHIRKQALKEMKDIEYDVILDKKGTTVPGFWKDQ